MTALMRPMLLGDVIRFGSGKSIKPGGEGRYLVFGSNGVIGHCDEFHYENGIIIGRVGAYCGSVAYCPEKFWASDNTLVAFPASNGFDTKFLFYLLHNARLSRYAGGAAQPLVTQTVLKQVEVEVPPLPIQRRIANILSAYDELMENCQRRIRILEEMARDLYREWFVHFRFPGHEKIPRVDSTLGPIPKGWEVKKLAEIADVNRAQINARTAPDELHYIDISSVSPGQIDAVTTYTFADAPGRARRIVQHGDTLWSCVRPNRRSHALLIQPPTDTIASTGFAVLTPKDVPFPFLYLATTTDEFVSYLTNHATGAAYPAVTATTFEGADLIVPPAPLLTQFADVAVPMAKHVSTLHRKIQNLRRTRDLLLPRLLSGQVPLDVSEDVAEPTTSAPPPSATDFADKEPLLRAAEEAPRYRLGSARDSRALFGEPAEEPASPQEPRTSQPPVDSRMPPGISGESRALPIHQIERTDVLQIIRQVFSEGPPRPRDDAIRDVARALGYRRTGARIQSVLHADLLTAVRRGILENTDGTLRLCARSITDLDRNFLKAQFLAAIGRPWIDRDTAIRDFCRWLGFARTGPVIEDTARSLINGLLAKEDWKRRARK